MPTFTPKQAAEILEIPASTLRRYRSLWSSYLSAPDEKRSYTQDDLNTLRIIRDLINQRKPKDDIIAALQDPVDQFIFEDTQPAPEPQRGIQSIEFFSQVLDQMTEQHKSVIMAKDETINGLRSDKDRMQTELSWLRLPWYKKLLRNPPE